MINTQEIKIGKTTRNLIKYRSFTCRGEKYTVFIDPATETEDYPGDIFMLIPLSDGTYAVPPKEISDKLYSLCVDMFLYQSRFTLSADRYPDVILLPWND